MSRHDHRVAERASNARGTAIERWFHDPTDASMGPVAHEIGSMVDRIEAQLRDRFGLEAFRPWQRDAIVALLEEPRRVLVVAPTGGGKSLTYQLPATLLDGTTVVVSPLISLMEDQVRSLDQRGIAATYLASTLGAEENAAREARIRRGEMKLVYVAPERLASDRAMRLLRELRPPLVAIDEAHCISQWGHDFRPDYLRLGQVLETLRPAHVLACTATATPMVRDEILARLGLSGARVVLRGFARPNLRLEATTLDSSATRKRLVAQTLESALGSRQSPRGAAIVYASTRRDAERLGGQLRELGHRAGVYHAGLDAAERTRVNRSFASGELTVVSATNAFGMGIDRPDVRLVLHAQAPGSIEAYYQEVGRAGRDGEPALGLLLSSSADLALRHRLVHRVWEETPPPKDEVERQWQLFLDLMRYVEAGSCRHDFILRYFGDDEELLGGCGHCDVCERIDSRLESPHATHDAARIVRIALSGVARTKAQVGMRAVAEMLVGKPTQMVRKWGFDELSTFGLLKEHDAEWIVALLRRLITAGYIGIRGVEYPKPALTPRGAAVMRGVEEPKVLLPGKSSSRRSKTRRSDDGDVGPADRETFEALRQARIAEARRQGVPAYVICSDRTLAEIAARRPSTRDELLDVRGMGPARVASYGELLLDAVRAATGR